MLMCQFYAQPFREHAEPFSSLQPGGFPLIIIAFRLFNGCQRNGGDYGFSKQGA